jgi:hypothetical protein
MSTKLTKVPSTAAERMRLYRTRRHNGLRSVRVLLHETEIDSLIHKGFLSQDRRHNPTAVENAIGGFICCELGQKDGES